MTANTESPLSTSQNQVHRRRHDWNDPSSITESLIEVISSLEQVNPNELPPLYNQVDMEAVKGVLMDGRGIPRKNTSVSFVYQGYNIHVHSEGIILVSKHSSLR